MIMSQLGSCQGRVVSRLGAQALETQPIRRFMKLDHRLDARVTHKQASRLWCLRIARQGLVVSSTLVRSGATLSTSGRG